MFNEDGSVALIYNGEIYNFQELRKELTNHTFQSKTDSEVLIHGYEEWGIEGLLNRIDGMFAFAIMDFRKNRLVLARDPLGQKPLFYSMENNALVFSSGLSALVKLLDHSPQVDESSLQQYLIQTFISGPQTIYEGVKKLLPGNFLVYDLDHGSHKIASYWTPEYKPHPSMKMEDAMESTRSLLKDAIRKRLVADVPVGAFLSGGIDSSLITSILFQELNYDCKTFTVKFNVDQYDESIVAREIAKKLGSEHHEYEFDLNLTQDLPGIIEMYGEPFGDHSALPTYYLSKHSVQHIKVALSGDGGDESFAGYNTSKALKAAQKFNTLLRNRSMFKLFRSVLEGRNKRARWITAINERRNGQFIYDPMGDRGYRNYVGELFQEDSSVVLQRSDALNLDLWDHSKLDWVTRGLEIDLKNKLPWNMLVKVDVASMAHGLELRSPLLDRSLVEFAGTIPTSIKFPGYETKPLLRKLAANYLPSEIISRPKKGFSLPVDQWIRNNREYVEDNIRSSSDELGNFLNMDLIDQLMNKHYRSERDSGRQIWLILILSLWFKNQNG